MEKRKYDLSKYAEMCETTEIEGKDGTKVNVRNHIPYDQKEEMATEMAEILLMIHDDSCMFTNYQRDKVEKFMIAKYYTDIDTEDAEMTDIADFMINNELYDKIDEFVWDDLDEVRTMFRLLEKSVTKTYEDDKCITKALRTSFGFLFTGEDITESLAKAEAAKDTIYEAVNALRKVEKEREEKIDHGKLSFGGNIINFAKKTE